MKRPKNRFHPTVQSGPIVRTRAMERQYINRRRAQPGVCQFCAYIETPEDVREHFNNFFIVDNIFPYAVWDGCHVSEHMLLVPRRHVESLRELTTDESAEYLGLVSDLEAQGYAIYSRPAGSAGKSIPHQHTHLIKINNVRIKTLYYNFMPHVLWFK